MAKSFTVTAYSVNFAVLIILCYYDISPVSADGKFEKIDLDSVARGEVQSCRGCSLKRLPDVRSFIYDDIPKYSGLEFHPIQGAVPHLVLFDDSDKELTRIDLSDLSRAKCNDLVSKWFTLKPEFETNAKDHSREEL